MDELGYPRRLVGADKLKVFDGGRAVALDLQFATGQPVRIACGPNGALQLAAHLIGLAQAADAQNKTTPLSSDKVGDWVDAPTLEPTHLAIADGRGPRETALVFTVGRMRLAMLVRTDGLEGLKQEIERRLEEPGARLQ